MRFTNQQRTEIENIVASLTIKRIPDPLIIKHIQNTTGHTITRMTLWNIRQRLKKEACKWYSQLKQGEYEYLHQFKERINEIVDLQRQHHVIIIRNEARPDIQQTSLAELHKLNVTLSNYYDIAPFIVSNIGQLNNNNNNGNTLSSPQQTKDKIIV